MQYSVRVLGRELCSFQVFNLDSGNARVCLPFVMRLQCAHVIAHTTREQFLIAQICESPKAQNSQAHTHQRICSDTKK